MKKPEIFLHKNDLPDGVAFGDAVAVDTESMGLNPLRDRLCLVQLSGGNGVVHLVQIAPGQRNAPNLKKLFEAQDVVKIFHFARADLAMIAKNLDVMPSPVYCTKVASVIARTFTERHGLKDLARELLGIELAKEQQTSDWGAPDLTSEQKAYAASDVLHLHALRDKLESMLVREGRQHLAHAAHAFLPSRALLDIAGWGDADIFAYKVTRP